MTNIPNAYRLALLTALILSISQLCSAQLAVSKLSVPDHYSLNKTQAIRTVRFSANQREIPDLRTAILDAALGKPGLTIPVEHRALFCRFDDTLDRKNIPLRMRLGSLDEVNRLEQKPGWKL